jgi:DNA-binding IclR family transcriptional regulator
MAVPLMQELADRSGVAAALGTRDGSEMVYLASCRSLAPVSLRLNVGSRLPIWNTAMGLAYLVEMKPEPRAALIGQMVEAHPDQAGRIRDLVGEAEDSYRKLGFVSVFGSWFSYINAVGLAFRPTDGSPLVAITCGGIVDVLPKEHCLERIGPDLVRTVERLRARLNGTAEPPPLP